MKHHSHQELDEKIHAFLASKSDIVPDLKVAATDTYEHEEVTERKFNIFNPFIPLETTRFSK